MSPIIRACQKKSINYFILHTGQHYDPDMDAIFFEEMELPKPKYNLNIGSRAFRNQVGSMISGMKKVFLKEEPDAVIVQGDTITVLTAALAAKTLDIPVAHHEAGLRSHDLSMPEETNRIITDHISEFLFFPTDDALRNISEESLNAKHYYRSGNTIVDAVHQNLALAEKKSRIMQRLRLTNRKYALLTAHRAENTNSKERMSGILEGVELIIDRNPGMKVIFPMHPRTRKILAQYKLNIPEKVTVTKPLGFLDFLLLEKNASLAITDSGGVQEECSILHVPVVTIRDNTERPETIAAGMNVLAGTDPQKIAGCAEEMLSRKIEWKSLFGEGDAGEKILDELISQIKKRKSLKSRSRWVYRLIKKNMRLN
jgi:UDP-N-acetylglucosamine 2-epimerase (non-hydrolysing)